MGETDGDESSSQRATAADAPVSSAWAESGTRQRIGGRYELTALLGTGGMGTVYRVRDLELDELVALKLLKSEMLEAPGALDRFRREVKLARRVTHKNVARTYDIGEHDGQHFLTMEYVPGEALSLFLQREHPLAVSRVVELGTQVAEGLAAAHEAGVIHRDLKPHNVLLEDTGRVVLMDFGIAQLTQHEPGSATTLGQLVGTPAYMAPEQLAGMAVDARADIYALGLVLWELATAQLPWQRSSPVSTALARLSEPPPVLASRRAGLPPQLEALIHRCLERDPEQRPQSAREVAGLLSELAPQSELAPTVAHPELTVSALVSTEPDAAPEPTPQGQTVQSPALQLSTASGPPTLATATSVAGVAESTGVRTVAVLPFVDRGGVEAYLVDGLTEDLIDVLSMSPGVRVRPFGSVTRQRGSERDAIAVGQELGVEVVVDGSVRRAGESLIVRTRLIGTSDGFQLWAHRSETRAQDLFALSEQLAEAVTEALIAPKSRIAPRQAPTDPEALDLYFRARHEYGKLDAKSVLRAVELYQRAVELAPNDAAILTGSALAHARHWFFGGVGTAEQASSAAERAVAVAPDRAEAHLALASVRVQQGELVQAVQSMRRALVLNPALAEAHAQLGRILAETGPAELALMHLTSASDLDPSSDEPAWVRARVLALTGRWEAAWRELEADEPSIGCVLHRVRLCLWKKDAERAATYLEQLGSAPEHQTPRRLLELISGNRTELDVDAVFNPGLGSKHSSGRGAAFRGQIRGELFVFQGMRESALLAFEEASAAGLADELWLDQCPLLHELRDDLRLLELSAPIAARALQVREAL